MSFKLSYEVGMLTPNLHNLYRSMLKESWSETYSSEVGDKATASMISSLASDDLGGLVPSNDETVMLATIQNNIVGSVIAATRHQITYIWGCYVLKRFQRQGIGRTLMLESISACDNSDGIVQLTVLRSSVGAVRFYESLGFEYASEEAFELLQGLKVPSITMVAKVSELQIRNGMNNTAKRE